MCGYCEAILAPRALSLARRSGATCARVPRRSNRRSGGGGGCAGARAVSLSPLLSGSPLSSAPSEKPPSLFKSSLGGRSRSYFGRLCCWPAAAWRRPSAHRSSPLFRSGTLKIRGARELLFCRNLLSRLWRPASAATVLLWTLFPAYPARLLLASAVLKKPDYFRLSLLATRHIAFVQTLV